MVAVIENNMDVPLTNISVAYRNGIHTVRDQRVPPGETKRIVIAEARRLNVDQSRASWPREETYLRGTLERDMGFALESPKMPLVNNRDMILGGALDQGAAVLFCSAPPPSEGFKINGDSIAPEGARHIQVVTYSGVQL